MKRLVLLGSTGSIGRQTLEVVRQHPEHLKVVGLAAGSNAEALLRQAAEFPEAKLALYQNHPAIPSGMGALVDLASMEEADVVVVSVAGVIGLQPTLAAIEAGKTIALASKEVLVAAGELVMPLVRAKGASLLPIDSEHSAIHQCLRGYACSDVAEIILTASGGPFRGRKRDELRGVTPQQALRHPTWTMGGKITLDSATLMNKGLEMIEARWLFDVPIQRVRAVVHPQSIVHSMVRLNDGSVLAQMGWPDMRLPIQVALLHPERRPNNLPAWNPLDTPELTFEEIDEEAFPCPALARRSAEEGGTMPCAMNAANEEAANLFLKGQGTFLGIAEVVREVMARHRPVEVRLDTILKTDRWARETARELIRNQPRTLHG
ncbi:MAG: 1-deoxy-D-xylulose-5-phosphate reductoisomerase [Fimbriimonadales bacterium]|nr:1-deoxy-D-xylulose-5-phosphate reductoisomerase [Fimbriimonadales bacterium]